MGAALGVPGLLLMKRKPQNYLTISYVNSSGNKAVAALDLSNGDLWIAIPILEARTGRKVIRNDRAEANVESPQKSPPRALEVVSTGTAFAVSGDGFFLTNSHVVAGCTAIALRGIGDSSLKASVWAQDPTNDLALLKTPGSAVPVLRFADSNQLRLGQSVVVIGYPLSGTLASGIKVTTGTVSSLAGMYDDTRMVQVSAPIQPGNSGGPVFDEGGSVIGVICMTLGTVGQARETGKIPQNMNFAIKASIARVFLESNNVRYATGQIGNSLDATRIAETTGPSIMLAECWK
jgi:S1-C subfamily serine protease